MVIEVGTLVTFTDRDCHPSFMNRLTGTVREIFEFQPGEVAALVDIHAAYAWMPGAENLGRRLPVHRGHVALRTLDSLSEVFHAA